MAGTARSYQDAVYQQLARLGKAVASPRRLELLDLLGQGPRSVERLAREASLSVANASQHLRAMHAARLVDTERQGTHVVYRLAGDDVAAFARALRLLARDRLAEVGRLARDFADDPDTLEMVDAADLTRRARRGLVTVLDVRPAEEFAAGHLPGARSLPLPELNRRLHELPRRRHIVAYCRGPFCVMAGEAVRLLRKHGFTATRLEEGVPDWRSRGFRIEQGAA